MQKLKKTLFTERKFDTNHSINTYHCSNEHQYFASWSRHRSCNFTSNAGSPSLRFKIENMNENIDVVMRWNDIHRWRWKLNALF